MPDLDLVVAGGGPAGLATALYAARAGLRAAVVEPRAAPIDKACGEGLLPPAVAALHELGVHPRGVALHGIRYLAEGIHAQAGFGAAGPGLGVRRTVLHAALADAVRAAGVELVPATVGDVEQDRAGVWAAGLRARYLVGADGLHSRVRRLVDPGAAARTSGRRRWGMRAHVPVRPWTDLVEVYWAANGEAYVTPIGPDCVGVAILGGRGGSFAARLDAFPALVERLAGAQPGPVLAAGPMRQRVRRRVRGRVLLVGDAAGYVDALTGEGIALALRCARALVERVAEHRPARYEHDYRRISRRYRLLTGALVGATAHPGVRARLVPVTAREPWLFRAAVAQLAR